MKKIDITEKRTAKTLLWLCVLWEIGVPFILVGTFAYLALNN